MAKTKLNDHKFVLLVAALLSSTIAFIILRSLLTNPGIIEAIDIQWNQYFSMFEYFFHTWNFYTNGSNIIFASQFPVYGWVLVFRDVALAQRFVYFLTISLISFNMFLVAFYTLKSTVQRTYAVYLGSIVASLIYTLNPLIFTEIFHISFLWAYSLFPLVFYFGWESFNNSSRRKVLVNALLLSVFFAFMADAWGILVGLLILVIVAISSAVMNGRKNLIHRFVPNFLLTLLITGVVTVLLAAFWFLPYITQRASEPVWDLFSVANLVRNSQESSLSNIFGLHSWNGLPFFTPSFWWLALTLLLPIVAVSAVWARRSKLTLTLSILLVVGFFLATGVKYANVSGTGVWPPFGDFYLWLTFYSPTVLSVQSFLLKYPYLFLAMASLAVAFLSAVLVKELFERVTFSGLSLRGFSTKSQKASIVLFFSIISLIALVGSPLLTGNLMGALNPVTLPSQYEEVNNFFASQNRTFRVMWVPQAGDFNWSNNEYANKVEYWGSGASPLLYGWGIVASPNTGYLGDLVYDYLSTNQTQYIGKLLALDNVQYIVFHNDSRTGDKSIALQAFESYFESVNNYTLAIASTSDYQDILVYKKYVADLNNLALMEGFENSSEYQDLLNSATYSNTLNSIEDLKNNPNCYPPKNSDLYNIILAEEYALQAKLYFAQLEVYRNRDFNSSQEFANFNSSVTMLNSYIDSSDYKNFAKYLNSTSVQMNFISTLLNSREYESTHNYLNTSDILISLYENYLSTTRTEAEYKEFLNTAEFKGFFSFLNSTIDSSLEYYLFSQSLDYIDYLSYISNNLETEYIFNVLQSQKDLSLLPLGGNYVFVFENTEMMNYLQAFSKANLVVGGLDTVGFLSSISDFYLSDSAFLFVENQHISESTLASILSSEDFDKTLTFYDSKTFNEFVLDTIDTGSYLAPSEVFIQTNSLGWLKDTVTSYSWTPLTLGSYAGQKYDFGLGHNLLYTTIPGAYFDIPAKVDRPGNYSIWLRVLFSPGGGNLTLSIDDEQVGQPVKTNSTVLTGFKWVNLANAQLDTGSHTLNFTSSNGLNAVSLVALPTVPELEEHIQIVTNLLNQSNARIVYMMDKIFLSSAENNGEVSIFTPYPSSYIINFQTNQTLTSIPLKLNVDNQAQSVFSTNSFSVTNNWYSTGAIDLSQGRHDIELNTTNVDNIIIYSANQVNGSIESLNDILGNGAQPYVVSYEKTGPASFSAKVNASKPFILSFNEAYDEFWQSNTSAIKLILNSVGNGFIVNDTYGIPNNELVTINIYYSPETTFQLGMMITAVSLVLVIAAISLVAVFPKVRKKGGSSLL
jgi:hypothetical protein